MSRKRAAENVPTEQPADNNERMQKVEQRVKRRREQFVQNLRSAKKEMETRIRTLSDALRAAKFDETVTEICNYRYTINSFEDHLKKYAEEQLTAENIEPSEEKIGAVCGAFPLHNCSDPRTLLNTLLIGVLEPCVRDLKTTRDSLK